MSALQANPFLMAGGDDDYKIERSLRFNSGDSAYLNRTPSSVSNRKTWTWSGWVKRTKLGGVYPRMFGTYTGGSYVGWDIEFNNNDKIDIHYYNGSSYVFRRTTTAVYRDSSAWYHIVVAVDTTQGTANDRLKLYVNGVQVTAFDTIINVSQNYDTNINTTVQHRIGYNYSYTDFYLADVHFIDGQALAPTDFGQTDGNGVWQPIKYSGTYGTNGFHLDFADNSSSAALGTDTSGNSNTWTVNNISVAAGAGNDSLRDSPSQIADQSDSGAGGEVIGNYCVINPLGASSSTPTVSDGNLKMVLGSSQGTRHGTMGVTSGKWYFEVVYTAASAFDGMVGVANKNHENNLGTYTGGNADGWGYYYNGQLYNNGGQGAYGASWTTNDVMGIALDMDNGAIYFSKNGTYQNSGDPTSGSSKTGAAFTNLSGTIFPCMNGYGGTQVVNFGQRPFNTNAPSGYKCWNTANLPDPTIADGSQYFDTHLYTGNSSASQALTLPFEPGMMWHKKRDSASSHYIHDAIRGFANNKAVIPNRTNVEGHNSYYYSLSLSGTTLTAGDTNGGNEWNANNSTYVNWLWKGGSSTVTNTSGTMTSQVRANPTAGFSIATYTSPNSSSNQSFGHGLNVKPDLVIVKNRDSSYNWDIYLSPQGYNSSLIFSSSGTRSGAFSSEPTSSVVNTQNSYTHVGTNKYVAYCFAAIEGYSAMGQYTGNGSSDGAFIYTGFKPAFLLQKSLFGGEDWMILDPTRDPNQPMEQALFANLSNSETTSSTYGVDFVSNGFKMRTSSTRFNSNNSNYIYIAFAEHPFKTARAR